MRSVLSCLAAAAIVNAASLSIAVTDGGGKPLFARIEVRGGDGKFYQPEGALRDRTAGVRAGKPYYVQSFVIDGRCTLEVPAGRYRVIAEHGPEYERVERDVTVDEKPVALQLRLGRWIDMRRLGYFSGDMHVHRPLDDLAALAQAEDLHFTVAISMWNRRTLWDGRALPERAIREAAPGAVLSVMNAEDERGGGAWMFHNIPEPLDLASMLQAGARQTESWFPPGMRFIEQVRAWRKAGTMLPWFDSEKAIWWETPVVMALAPPDSLGLLNNHFNQYGMLDNEAWGRARDTAKYPGYAGFAEYSMTLSYRYWNLGFRTPASAGSASGVLPNPVGYNRIYARLDGPFDAEKWYGAVKEHRHFVTNGPMLFFETSLEGSRLRGTVDVRAREALDRVELIANGKTVKTFAIRPGARRLREAFSLDVSGNSWVAARAFVKNEDTIRLAHSSPVFVPGRFDASEDARYFVQWIDELIANTTASRVADAGNRETLLGLYRRAREFYANR